MRNEHTEVLVVGAGPVGLMSALLLAEADVQVQIIDREERTAVRSYACALHPRTLRLLDRLGVASPLIAQGRKVPCFGFYDGKEKRAEVKFSALAKDFPFVLIVPQNTLESLLEERLRDRGVRVNWQHRFDDFHEQDKSIVTTLEQLGGTSTGYIVPHWETVVQKRFHFDSQFVIGADGHNSLVRQRLPMAFTSLSAPEFFAAYEFESTQPPEDEVKIVLDEKTTNVLWPLPGNKCRWTFQLVKSEVASEFPEKERRAVRVADQVVDATVRSYVEKIATRRAPWFSSPVRDVTWCTDVVFEHRLVKEFGRGRIWLAGDSAHQTGPIGAQSMNVGICEAETLVQKLTKVLHEEAPLESVSSYNQERMAEWRALLGINGGPQPGGKASSWVRERLPRLLSCLPGSGEDLEKLASQLGCTFS